MSSLEIAELYNLMEREGAAEFVLYEGGVTSWQTWVEYIVNSRCWLVRCTHPELGISGLWWLNGFIGRTAMIHFCALGPRTLKEKIDEGRQAMKWLQELGCIDSVYGLTPKPYRNVWPYMEGLGFEKQGALPGACYMSRFGRHVDGIISVLDLSKYNTKE